LQRVEQAIRVRCVPLAHPNQYAAMLDAAADGGFAYPAVNVTSSQTLNAALDGFAAARSDGIVQVTVGGAGYLSGGGKAHAVAGAKALALMAGELAARVPVLIALHTDHCPPAQEESFLRPLIDASRERGTAGEPPLFCSHMFDGSTLSLDENLRRSAELLALCRDAGIVLEVEVGVVGGEEDGIGGDGVAGRYTTPDDLLCVARALGTGERGRYLLAATFGNVHGLTAPGTVELRPEILRDGQEMLGREWPGARFEYVFHGSSGSAADDLAAAVSYGVVKVNLDSEAQYAFTRAAAEHMVANREGVLAEAPALGDKRAYDPRAWGAEAEAGMAARVAQACELLGSARRSILA
jgi:fructose-bisphosphate aldolase, class II